MNEAYIANLVTMQEQLDLIEHQCRKMGKTLSVMTQDAMTDEPPNYQDIANQIHSRRIKDPKPDMDSDAAAPWVIGKSEIADLIAFREMLPDLRILIKAWRITRQGQYLRKTVL